MILLDTDSITILQRGSGTDHGRLIGKIRQHSAEVIATTINSYEEQMRGWLAFVAKARTMPHQVESYRRLLKHLEDYREIPLLTFDELAAIEFQRLRQSRLRVGTMDLKIAAIALARDATLVTRNLADFGKIPGLRAEVWTSQSDQPG